MEGNLNIRVRPYHSAQCPYVVWVAMCQKHKL